MQKSLFRMFKEFKSEIEKYGIALVHYAHIICEVSFWSTFRNAFPFEYNQIWHYTVLLILCYEQGDKIIYS